MESLTVERPETGRENADSKLRQASEQVALEFESSVVIAREFTSASERGV